MRQLQYLSTIAVDKITYLKVNKPIVFQKQYCKSERKSLQFCIMALTKLSYFQFSYRKPCSLLNGVELIYRALVRTITNVLTMFCRLWTKDHEP